MREAEIAKRMEVEANLRKAEEMNRRQQEHYREEERLRQETLRKVEEAHQQEERIKQETEQQKLRYRQMKVCQYCGGAFTGLFNKKCKVCGKPKDYT